MSRSLDENTDLNLNDNESLQMILKGTVLCLFNNSFLFSMLIERTKFRIVVTFGFKKEIENQTKIYKQFFDDNQRWHEMVFRWLMCKERLSFACVCAHDASCRVVVKSSNHFEELSFSYFV